MSGPPRSQCLIRYSTTAGSLGAEFACPAGCVTLVKSVYITNTGAADAATSVTIGATGMTPPVYIFNQVIVAGKGAVWDGWVVLNPTDAVLVSTNQPAVTIWVSGAILLGPPPFPPTGPALLEEAGPVVEFLPGEIPGPIHVVTTP